jgi:ribosomal protein RSM22 (predicted rRNA methylase)
VTIIPDELRRGILEIISGKGSLAGHSESLSAHYRKGGVSGKAIDLETYLVTRMPATYAAVSRCLLELHPDFIPHSILDAGSGPGTASWAATQIYSKVSKITFLDKNTEFLGLARKLAARSPNIALRDANEIVGDILNLPCGLKADLVMAGYALAELPVEKALSAAMALWQACNHTLVIIEPGTPEGFHRVHSARAALMAAGANILAPCTHENDCPMRSPDWCHFKVRLPRSREHLHAKKANVPFEDEKFSYIIASRQSADKAAARILTSRTETKHSIGFKLCSQEGLKQQNIARRDKGEYKRVRRLEWGDLF